MSCLNHREHIIADYSEFGILIAENPSKFDGYSE